MKVLVIEIIQSPVGQMNLLLIFFLTYYSVSVYWINLNLIRVKNLRSSRGGSRKYIGAYFFVLAIRLIRDKYDAQRYFTILT